MGYYINIEFPEKVLNESADTIQLKLLLFTNLAGSDETWASEDYRLKVLSYGKSEFSYDFEDQTLTAGALEVTIGDLSGSLISFFFGTNAFNGNSVIAGTITLYRNGAPFFVGDLQEDALEYNQSNESITLRAIVGLYKLNEKPVYDDAGNFLDPLHTFKIQYQFIGVSPAVFPSVGDVYSNNGSEYEVIEAYNPSYPTYLITGRISGVVDPSAPSGTLTKVSGGGDASISYTSYITPEVFDYMKITEILEGIYQILDENNTVLGGEIIIKHNWDFWAKRDTDDAVLPAIQLDELSQDIGPLYYNPSANIISVGDVLRQLAIDWGCFAGALSNTKCFFVKLFYYDAANTQELGLVLDFRMSYQYQLISYVKVTTQISDPNDPYERGTYTRLAGRIIERNSLPGFYSSAGEDNEGGEAPSGTNVIAVISDTDLFVFTVSGVTNNAAVDDVYSNNSSSFQVVWSRNISGSGKITARRISGTNDPSSSGTLTRVSGSGDATISFSAFGDQSGTYDVLQARDPDLFAGLYNTYGTLMSYMWYYNRSTSNKNVIAYFRVVGVTYDFVKNFNYSGYKYQIIRMIIDWEQDETEIYALNLGAL